MAAPNLAGVTTITGKVTGDDDLSTTTSTAILTCPTNKVCKINTIIAANIDGTNNADVTVGVYDASEDVTYYLASTVEVAADTTVVVLTKESSIYLEESDEIRAGASATGDISLLVSYDEIGDA